MGKTAFTEHHFWELIITQLCTSCPGHPGSTHYPTPRCPCCWTWKPYAGHTINFPPLLTPQNNFPATATNNFLMPSWDWIAAQPLPSWSSWKHIRARKPLPHLPSQRLPVVFSLHFRVLFPWQAPFCCQGYHFLMMNLEHPLIG